MKLTCNQMEILTSFYLENELSSCLKQQFEDHLKNCKTCLTKFEVIKSIFKEMQDEAGLKYAEDDKNNKYSTNVHNNIINDKLSEYIDNELQDEENIRIKKIAITNKDVRKELEDSYNIRRLMSDSFKKTKADAKQDFVKSIMKQLEFEEEIQSGFNPAIKLLIVFTVMVIISAVTLIILFN